MRGSDHEVCCWSHAAPVETEFVIATTAVFIGRPAEEFQPHSHDATQLVRSARQIGTCSSVKGGNQGKHRYPSHSQTNEGQQDNVSK